MNATEEIEKCREKLDPLSCSDTVYFAVAYYEDKPAGFIAIMILPKLNAKKGYLYVDGMHATGFTNIPELFVDSKFRRRGIGAALLEYAKTLCTTLEYAGVRLLVRNENTNAQELYKKTGFVLSNTTFGQWLRI
jgi:ribosomal protein S18 acetylase RimI-like enzyme